MSGACICNMSWCMHVGVPTFRCSPLTGIQRHEMHAFQLHFGQPLMVENRSGIASRQNLGFGPSRVTFSPQFRKPMAIPLLMTLSLTSSEMFRSLGFVPVSQFSNPESCNTVSRVLRRGKLLTRYLWPASTDNARMSQHLPPALTCLV